MLHFERWKIIAIVATCLAGLLFAMPNFFSKETVAAWPSFIPHRQMPLGLDLRGGAHLLLAMDTAEVQKGLARHAARGREKAAARRQDRLRRDRRNG